MDFEGLAEHVYFLGQPVYSGQDRHKHMQGRLGILGLVTVHRTSATQQAKTQ